MTFFTRLAAGWLDGEFWVLRFRALKSLFNLGNNLLGAIFLGNLLIDWVVSGPNRPFYGQIFLDPVFWMGYVLFLACVSLVQGSFVFWTSKNALAIHDLIEYPVPNFFTFWFWDRPRVISAMYRREKES